MRTDTLEATGITIARSEGKSVPRQLDGIQILRGVAASIVVLHHFCQAFLVYKGQSLIASYHNFSWTGASGVDIFFCISGFVIVYSLLCRSYEVSWRSFLLARIKRIIPLYWLFTLFIIALWSTGRALTSLIVTPDLIFRSFLLLPLSKQWSYGRISTHPILDQGWTLQYEALFYIICAIVIALVGSKRIFPWVPLGVGLCAGISFLIPGAPEYLHDPLLIEFIGGTLLGWLTARGLLSRLPAKRLFAWGAIILGSTAILMTTFLQNPEPYRVLVWGIPGFMIVFGCILVTPQRGGRITDMAIFLGAASYSIYLGHGVITLFVSAAMKYGHMTGAGDISLIMLTVFTILITAMLYPLVEKPITKWLR